MLQVFALARENEVPVLFYLRRVWVSSFLDVGVFEIQKDTDPSFSNHPNLAI